MAGKVLEAAENLGISELTKNQNRSHDHCRLLTKEPCHVSPTAQFFSNVLTHSFMKRNRGNDLAH